eukprot:4592450-Ditylum_brightwellii.AAC.1
MAWVPLKDLKESHPVEVAEARKTSHKYGIEIPISVEHAYKIDLKNGNIFWHDAIKKEMYNVGIAFEILPEGSLVPVGWKK